jgi:hypothetical protein
LIDKEGNDMWQINGTINRDVAEITDLARSALPGAPVVPDRPSRLRVFRRGLASMLQAAGRRLDDRVDNGSDPRLVNDPSGAPSPAC